MTNILIPMAGAGQRFLDCGYKMSKPAILTTDRRTGKKLPMVVCAVQDLPDREANGKNIIFIDRMLHKTSGVEQKIKEYYSRSRFITVEDLTEGQACTCLLAKEHINNCDPLLIAGCDNGMVFDETQFSHLKEQNDLIVFTYRNDGRVLTNPDAYGWVIVNEHQEILNVSVKKAISEQPEKDHAIVATFWFKRGSIFVQAAEKMILKDERVNGEFYVDTVIKYVLEAGYKASVFEIERYIGWGTPKDYEDYENTLCYWYKFTHGRDYLGV